MPPPASTSPQSITTEPFAELQVNVADRLARIAAQMPDAVAVACPGRGDVAGRRSYRTCMFRRLDADASALARGLVQLGVKPGAKLVLLVRPGVEFVTLVFALLRSGATTILVDPGMGRGHLVRCLAASEPDGFVAISAAQAIRTLLRKRFPKARFNVTLGRRWFWGGPTYQNVLARGQASEATLPSTGSSDPAAIIFTSGSTGPPKGVLYTHRMFDTQAAEIQRAYALGPGGADLSCFALFGLFNSVMGVTTVFPEMDFARPASAEPKKLLAAANDWQVTQAFASPAVWNKLSRYCKNTGDRIPTLRSVFSCGAPVPAEVIRRTLACMHPEARMHTPYGATEALPVATIDAREVLGDTAEQTDRGAGVCVGRKFDSVDWRVVRISDEPIRAVSDAEPLPTGEVGELIVRGPQVSPAYHVDIGAESAGDRPHRFDGSSSESPGNRFAKIADGDATWHRMGDAGYFDDNGRFWYCGRKNHRVMTADGALFTIPVEAVFNRHPDVQLCALVGVGRCGRQTPVVVVQSSHEHLWGVTRPNRLRGAAAQAWRVLVAELRELGEPCVSASKVRHFLLRWSLPVDVRHNSKINREQLAGWAETQRLTEME